MTSIFLSACRRAATVTAVLVLFVTIISCSKGAGPDANAKKMLVLGFDGMDPVLLTRYMDAGLMPNFKSIAERGDFKPLRTSMPPQSPVAWSNFITGMNPGGHGIYDFIARDPANYQPYLSTSKTTEAGRVMKLGEWLIPFSRGETLLLRKGKSFWEILDSKGIPATVLKVPANFPPVESEARTISGMGTPDILGTYGTFTFYTTNEVVEDDFTSGRLMEVHMRGGTVTTDIIGPPNPLKASRPRLTVPLTISVDPENPVALIKAGDTEVIVREGEWTDWININFRLAPTQSISGITRFYLMEAAPGLELYMTPVNIDPAAPSVPISSPAGYSAEMAGHIGNYYTLGMPEDTKALDQGALDNDSFLKQADVFLAETLRMLELELGRFDRGLLFMYFSTTDPVQHMFWRNIDPEHPGQIKAEAEKYSDVIRDTYVNMDRILGDILKKIDEQTTLLIVSDHGFGAFRRYFHLNRWLADNGYLELLNKKRNESAEFFENVDFSGTRAYSLGFNGLYVNLTGREGSGIVSPGAEKTALLDELIRRLEAVTDPETGLRVIRKAYKKEDIYSGRYLDDAPDLLIGYDDGYRASWETALGKVPRGLIGDNLKRWSGDHLRDYTLVPGIVLSNRQMNKKDPALIDIAPTILEEFGIEPEPEMVGKPIF
jgi:predicted AlkP superfamily phosphohydrolase/phosphomutase